MRIVTIAFAGATAIAIAFAIDSSSRTRIRLSDAELTDRVLQSLTVAGEGSRHTKRRQLLILLRPDDLLSCTNHAARWRRAVAEASRYAVDVTIVFPNGRSDAVQRLQRVLKDLRVNIPVETRLQRTPLMHLRQDLVDALFTDTPTEMLIAPGRELITIRRSTINTRRAVLRGDQIYPSQRLRELLEPEVDHVGSAIRKEM